MPTVSELLWQHLRDSVGFPRTLEYRHIPDLPGLQRMKWNAEFWSAMYNGFVDWVYFALMPVDEAKAEQVRAFEQYMRNRLILGTFRYRVWEGEHHNHDYPQKMIERARLYSGDGNLEHLVDVANFALVEYTIAKAEREPKVSVERALIPVTQIENNVKLYRDTGQGGALVAVAVWALLGFVWSDHPKKHFGATDGHWHVHDHPDGSRQG